MSTTREICKCCGAVNAVGFAVPDFIWEASVPPRWIADVLCLNCFTRYADESCVLWDVNIKFYPVSRMTHVGIELTNMGRAVPARKPHEVRHDGTALSECSASLVAEVARNDADTAIAAPQCQAIAQATTAPPASRFADDFALE